MKQLFNILDSFLATFTILLIKLYQYTLSPDKGILSSVLKGRICSHEPHCSEYAIRTLKRYGFWRGVGKAADRILHCKPSMEKHYDPEYYKVVFFSSAPIGVPFLEALAKDKRFELIGVVSQADKPVGRGLPIQENIVKTKAKEL
jgi:putative membrane protein insertion efficiency factor